MNKIKPDAYTMDVVRRGSARGSRCYRAIERSIATSISQVLYRIDGEPVTCLAPPSDESKRAVLIDRLLEWTGRPLSPAESNVPVPLLAARLRLACQLESVRQLAAGLAENGPGWWWPGEEPIR